MKAGASERNLQKPAPFFKIPFCAALKPRQTHGCDVKAVGDGPLTKLSPKKKLVARSYHRESTMRVAHDFPIEKASVMNDQASIIIEESASFTREEFCKRNKISFSTFNKLQHQGRAPAMMRIGPLLIRITAEAEREWQKAMMRPTCEEAALQDRMKQASNVRAKKAGRLSVLSPAHIANVRRARRNLQSGAQQIAAARGRQTRTV